MTDAFPSSFRFQFFAAALCGVGVLASCGAELSVGEEGEEQSRQLQAVSFQSPFVSPTWRIGFDLYNAGLRGSTSSCFGTTMDKIKHAGEDWGGSTSTVVGAVGAGQVVYAGNVNYPGYVVVLRHDLSDSERRALGLSSPVLYSQYGHLTGVTLRAGDRVTVGQKLGTLINQSSNTHLHWEIRTAEKPPLCGTTFWGPGYTGPGTRATDYGYLSPSGSITSLQGGGAACPSGDGLYCGGNGVSGSAATLYRCSGGSLGVAETCASGCEHMPAGTSDRCATAPTTCAVINGLYCGGNGVSGAKNVLYRCTDRKLGYVETCAKGCDRRPAGTPDRCK